MGRCKDPLFDKRAWLGPVGYASGTHLNPPLYVCAGGATKAAHNMFEKVGCNAIWLMQRVQIMSNAWISNCGVGTEITQLHSLHPREIEREREIQQFERDRQAQ